MKRIAKAWNSYYEKVLVPVGAGRVQIIECRRAFYAGANALFGGIFENLTPGSEAEPADEQMLSDYQDEIEAFGEDIKAGRA